MPALFAAQAAATPDAVAAVCEGNTLSYRELDARANRLAHHLRALGVGPEVVVGLCVERSLEMLIGLIAILKAGGAYLPLDPGYPRERLAFMLSDAGAPVLLTQQALRAALPAHAARVVLLDADAEAIARHPATAPDTGLAPQHPAYVIYTSGSTGTPKGVVVTHRHVVRLVKRSDRRRPDGRCTFFASGAAVVRRLDLRDLGRVARMEPSCRLSGRLADPDRGWRARRALRWRG